MGFNLPITGAGPPTVNSIPLLACPLTVTTTGPVAAPTGTGALILVSLQLTGAALTPLNVTLLSPWETPKCEPLIFTTVPTAPEPGFSLLIVGAAPSSIVATADERDTIPTPVTAKGLPLLASSPALTTTNPLNAPAGASTRISVSLQEAGVPHIPLKLTPLVPCNAAIEGPKFQPLTVTSVPSLPKAGSTASITGAGRITVNAIPLLASPPAATVASPLGAPAGTAT